MKRMLRMDRKAWDMQDAAAKKKLFQFFASRDIGECLADSLAFNEDGETNHAVLISTRSYKPRDDGLEPWLCEIEVEVKEGSFQIVPLQSVNIAFPKEDDFLRSDPSDPEYVKALKARVKEAEATSDLAKQLFLGLIERAEEAEKRAVRAEYYLAQLGVKGTKESEK